MSGSEEKARGGGWGKGIPICWVFFKYFIFVTTSELKTFHKYQPLATPSRAFPVKKCVQNGCVAGVKVGGIRDPPRDQTTGIITTIIITTMNTMLQ